MLLTTSKTYKPNHFNSSFLLHLWSNFLISGKTFYYYKLVFIIYSYVLVFVIIVYL